MNNNFFKKVGQGFSNIPQSALYGVSILITSVAFLTTSLKMNTNYKLLEEIKKEVNNKEFLNKINEKFKVIQDENKDFKNKVIDKFGIIDSIKEKLMKECSEIKVLITNLQDKTIDLSKDVKKSLESLDSKFNETKDEIKKEVEDYQKYVLKQLQTSDEKDDNRNNTIMHNHNLVIEEIRAILASGEATDLELKKIQTLLLKNKAKLERIEDITAVNNIEIVKNSNAIKEVREEIKKLLESDDSTKLELKKIQTLLLKSKAKLDKIEDITAFNNVEIVELKTQILDALNNFKNETIKKVIAQMEQFFKVNSKQLIDINNDNKKHIDKITADLTELVTWHSAVNSRQSTDLSGEIKALQNLGASIKEFVETNATILSRQLNINKDEIRELRGDIEKNNKDVDNRLVQIEWDINDIYGLQSIHNGNVLTRVDEIAGDVKNYVYETAKVTDKWLTDITQSVNAHSAYMFGLNDKTNDMNRWLNAINWKFDLILSQMYFVS